MIESVRELEFAVDGAVYRYLEAIGQNPNSIRARVANTKHHPRGSVKCYIEVCNQRTPVFSLPIGQSALEANFSFVRDFIDDYFDPRMKRVRAVVGAFMGELT